MYCKGFSGMYEDYSSHVRDCAIEAFVVSFVRELS